MSTSTRPYRVMHLSDLHFGATFDASLWDYIGALAARERPNLIAITGDLVDHGGLFMLAVARREIEWLTNQASSVVDGSVRACEYRVVPGNHDVALWGNIKLPLVRSNFRAVFRRDAPIDIAGVPRFREYTEEWGWFKRRALRAWLTLVLYGRRAVRRWKHGRTRVANFLGVDDPPEVFLAQIDSNHGLRLATGNVDVRLLQGMQASIVNLRNETAARVFVPRIALLHHHALPIPYSDVKEGLTSFEPFLVLRNAGTVLRELCRADFDLVLHGHKHYASFSRLGYSTDLEVAGELAVIAAGSAGITHSEAGRNSLNLIDILPNGYMTYVPYYFGGGRSVDLGRGQNRGEPVHLVTVQKHRAFRRAVELQRQQCAEVRRIVRIDEAGTAAVTQTVRNCEAYESFKSDVRTMHLAVSMGRINPASIKLDAASASAGYGLVTSPQTPAKAVVCEVHLNMPIAPGTQPFSYGIEYVSVNNFAMTGWEVGEQQKALYRQHKNESTYSGRDWTGMVIRMPTRRLHLEVQLPNNLRAMQPEVRVMRWSDYPAIERDVATFEFDGDIHRDAEIDDACWIIDPILTEHERIALTQVRDDTWVLDVDFPLVGYRYDICWTVQSTEEEHDPGLARTTLEQRRALLSLSRRVAADDPTVAPNVRKLFEGVAGIAFKLFGSPQKNDETVAIALFVYDDADQTLKLVAQGRRGPAQSVDAAEIPLGEGVAGAAFKRRRPVLYLSPDIPGGMTGGAYIYTPDERRDERGDPFAFNVVAAFPVHDGARALPDNAPRPEARPPQETIGVLSIASDAADSRLIDLFRQQKPAGASTSQDLIVTLTGQILQGVIALAAQPLEPTGAKPQDTDVLG